MDGCPADGCDDGMLRAADHFSRTRTDGSDLNSCDPTPSSPGDDDVREVAASSHFVMNQFARNRLRMPSPRRARELNSYAALEARMEACRGKSLQPNLLAVEFWDEGDVVEFVGIMNAGRNREGGEYVSA